MGSVFDIFARIRLDDSEFKKGVNDAKGTFSTLASGLKTGLATVAKVGAAAVTAGVAGVTALTKMGVEGYAQYEQLVGGVETLFGAGGKSLEDYANATGKTVQEIRGEYGNLKAAQTTVLTNASNAFRTAGMSQNEYMETVTSFSASLIQSLGGDTKKAANVADMAITDMSDNANKMGTSMEMIQNAYNGFAKGNFTMLDNLKLGYGGTQEEMKRLLKDAEAISGIKYDISSFSDVTEAIHVMQEQMGIAGTTAREAASTIEGSISMMKGAWQNLVVGMADENANMEVLINNFVESTATAAQNLIPRIEQTLAGIGQLITAMAPIIADAFPGLVETLLPTIITAGISLIAALANAIVTALPAVGTALEEGLLIILRDVFGVSEEESMAFCRNLKTAFEDAMAFLSDSYDKLCGFVDTLIEGWESAVEWAKEHETTLTLVGVAVGTLTAAIVAYNVAQAIKNAGGIVELAQLASLAVGLGALTVAETAHTVATTVATAATTAFGAVLSFITSPITLVIAAIGSLIAVGVLLYKNWDEITEFCSETWAKVTEIWGNIKKAISDKTKEIVSNISQKFTEAKENVTKKLTELKNGANEKFQAMKENASEKFRAIKEVMGTLMQAAKDTVSEKLVNMKKAYEEHGGGIKGVASAAMEGVKGYYSAGYTFINNLTGGKLGEIVDKFREKMDAAREAVSSKISEIKNNLSDGLANAFSTVSSKLSSIKDKFSSIFDNCKKIVTNAIDAVRKAFDFSWSLPDLKLPHISVSGGKAPYGIGGKGSLPSFSIEWYKKAYDNAMILSNPTIFGYSAASGKFLGGGDGNGNEIVAGESYLMGLISNAVESKNEKVVSLLAALLEATVDGNTQTARALMADRTFAVGEREFARLVRTYA